MWRLSPSIRRRVFTRTCNLMRWNLRARVDKLPSNVKHGMQLRGSIKEGLLGIPVHYLTQKH
jgi:hypothetical protein